MPSHPDRVRRNAEALSLDMLGTPALLCDLAPTTRDEYLGIDRSVYPMLSITPELTAEEAFRCASFGIEPQPMSFPVVLDPTCDPMKPYFINLRDRRWLGTLSDTGFTPAPAVARDYEGDDILEQTITDELIAWMRDNPRTFAPANPYYRKNYLNAPGTVRSWFRAWRAAELERAIVATQLLGYEGWTQLDAQPVIDRETAAHYAPEPDTFTYYFLAPPPVFVIKLADMGKFGRIDNLRGDPASPGAGRERTE